MATFAEIVADYIRVIRPRARAEQRWFEIQRSLEQAIDVAALARSPSGKRLSHQRRIPPQVLEQSRRQLRSRISQIRSCKSFEALHDLVLSEIGGIPGAGELYVYDTALRIGAKLGLSPKLVFLHAGTRQGAKALGFEPSRKTLDPKDLPAAFRKLEPEEIEDVLCIYKGQLTGAAIVDRTGSACAPRKPTTPAYWPIRGPNDRAK